MIVDVSNLKSPHLSTDNNFQTCLQIILCYNEEVRESELKRIEIKNGPWKTKFALALQGLLREIYFTKDLTIQQKFCERANE